MVTKLWPAGEIPRQYQPTTLSLSLSRGAVSLYRLQLAGTQHAGTRGNLYSLFWIVTVRYPCARRPNTLRPQPNLKMEGKRGASANAIAMLIQNRLDFLYFQKEIYRVSRFVCILLADVGALLAAPNWARLKLFFEIQGMYAAPTWLFPFNQKESIESSSLFICVAD